MALREAITLIAEQMELTATSIEGKAGDPVGSSMLRVFAGQLRVALKASEGEVATTSAKFGGDFVKAQEALARDRAARQAMQAAESPEPRYVVVSGGPEDGVTVPVPADMPVGARVSLGGTVYELIANGTLHVQAEEK